MYLMVFGSIYPWRHHKNIMLYFTCKFNHCCLPFLMDIFPYVEYNFKQFSRPYKNCNLKILTQITILLCYVIILLKIYSRVNYANVGTRTTNLLSKVLWLMKDININLVQSKLDE